MDAAIDAGQDAGTVRPPDVCDELGLPRVAMRPSTGAGFDDVAGDFTVETLDGPWTLSEEWTGCDSYVFLNYASTTYGNGLFATFPDGLAINSPRNVHYFFTSYERSADAIRTRMEALRAGLEEGFELFELSEEDRAFWRSRMHFVVEPLVSVEGSIGELARTQTIVHHSFGIGRDQRFDPVGSLFQLTRGGFTPDFGMAAYAGHWFNYLANLQARLDAERDVTVVPVMDETDVTLRTLDRSAELPPAATMETFDTLEIDLEIHCRLDPAGCSEWDRNAYILYCVDEACSDTRELARWITPYSRPGRTRWVMDASPLLGLVRAGGTQRFRIVTGPDWEEPTPSDVRVALRLSRRGSGPVPAQAERAFTGGEFVATYNEGRTPFAFTPPADARKVELVVIVSGHGQTEGDNCAEWCNHEHTFTVNGTARHDVSFPGEAGRPLGCAERAAEGVVPGQWGNWAPSRAAWCPGFPVAARRFDITSEVRLGEPNELTYRGSFMGGEPRGGTIDLSTYVVYYR
jgi:hypothetical protein